MRYQLDAVKLKPWKPYVQAPFEADHLPALYPGGQDVDAGTPAALEQFDHLLYTRNPTSRLIGVEHGDELVIGATVQSAVIGAGSGGGHTS